MSERMQKYIHKENLALKEQEGCRCLLWYRRHTGWWKGFVVLSTFPPGLKNKLYINFTKKKYTIIFSAEFVQHTFACLCSSSWTNSQSLEILVCTLVIIVIINSCGWNVTKTAKRVTCLSPHAEIVNNFCPIQYCSALRLPCAERKPWHI